MNGDLRQLIRRIKLVLDGKPSRAAVACGRAWSWLLLCTCAALLFCSEGSAQVIRRVSSPGKFYVDDKAGVGVVYNSAVYTISNNTATTFPGVFVAITNIVSTNRVQLTATDSGARALGALAPGQTKMAAYYLIGPSFTGNSDTLFGLTNENHTIRVQTARPASAPCSPRKRSASRTSTSSSK